MLELFWPSNRELQNEVKLYETIQRIFSGCSINTQWKIPTFYQSTSGHSHLIQFLKGCLETFFRNAEPAEKGPPSIWGHTWYIGKLFLQIQMRHHQHLILKKLHQWNSSIEGAAPFIYSGEKVTGKKTRSRSEMPVLGPSSQKNSGPSSVEETLQSVIGQTNNDCRFRIFISTKFPYTSHILLPER